MEYLFDSKINIFQTIAIAMLLVLVGCSIIINPILSVILFSIIFLSIYIYLKPYFGLFICIATAPVLIFEIFYDSPIRQISDYFPLGMVIIAITFYAWNLRRVVKLEVGNQNNQNQYFLPLLFISYAVISLLWSIDVIHGLCLTFRISVSICFFFLLNDMINSRKKLKTVINYLPYIALILASMTLISKYKFTDNKHLLFDNFYLQIRFWSQNGVRPSGFAGSALASNTLVFFIFMTIPAYATAESNLKKILLITISLFCLSMMLLVSAKAAVGGLLVGMFFIIWYHPNFRNKRILLSVMVIATIVSVYAFNAVLMKGGDRLTGSSDVAAHSVSTRLEYWKTGFSFFYKRWIGAGAGGILKELDPVVNSHSTYFSILFDFGLLGLSIFITFLIQAFFCLRKAINNCNDEFLQWSIFGISGAFIALLIHALVDDFHYDRYFWLVLGLVFTITNIANNSIEEKNEIRC